MTTETPFDALFSGIIGQEYHLLKLICPYATEMSRLVGVEVTEYCQHQQSRQHVVELGGGSGITSLSILSADDKLHLLSIDNEAIMQNQAKQSLHSWVEAGRLHFSSDDALSALQKLDSNSVDILASAYTLHNFETGYRKQVVHEIYRVLKPAGVFVNGDRYALDDIDAHTRMTQQEIAEYFRVLTNIERSDLLEQWIIHLFNDESENHIMRESVAMQQMMDAGFAKIQLKHRKQINALVTATK